MLQFRDVPLPPPDFLRTVFAMHTTAHDGSSAPTVEPLKRILLLGAIPENDTISKMDLIWMEETLIQLGALGIPVHPDFDIEVVNRHPLYGNRDFLTHDTQADLIVSCLVHDPEPRRRTEFAAHGNDYNGISALHGQEGIWHQRSRSLGAKAIVVFGRERELNARHFAGSGYLPVHNFLRITIGSVLLNGPYREALNLKSLADVDPLAHALSQALEL